jgi:hypothetical protein
MSEQEHGHQSVSVLKPEVPLPLVVKPSMCASGDQAHETAPSVHASPYAGPSG